MGNTEGNWILSEELKDYETEQFRTARNLAHRILLSTTFYEFFKRNSSATFTQYQFRAAILMIPFRLKLLTDGSAYGVSAGASVTQNVESFDDRLIMERSITINEKLLRILMGSLYYKHASKLDKIKCLFVVVVTLLHECSHLLNFIFNFSEMIVNSKGVYRTPPGKGGEFGEFMEVSLFGSVVWIKEAHRFVKGVDNIRLVDKTGTQEVVNVDQTLIDNMLENPEAPVQLQLEEMTIKVDTSCCTVNNPFCTPDNSPDKPHTGVVYIN